MKPAHLLAAILALPVAFPPPAHGGKTQDAVAAADSGRLVAYYKKVVEWSESAECRSIRARKDLGSFFAKLVDIAQSVGYEGDARKVNKQIASDQKAHRHEPGVKEWEGKFNKAVR